MKLRVRAGSGDPEPSVLQAGGLPIVQLLHIMNLCQLSPLVGISSMISLPLFSLFIFLSVPIAPPPPSLNLALPSHYHQMLALLEPQHDWTGKLEHS